MGESSRSVIHVAPTNDPARTVKSRGPDTPMLVSRVMRLKRMARTVAKSRRTGENAKQPFQPLRGEGRVFSARPVVPAACIF
jgi:hypothetical protein